MSSSYCPHSHVLGLLFSELYFILCLLSYVHSLLSLVLSILFSTLTPRSFLLSLLISICLLTCLMAVTTRRGIPSRKTKSAVAKFKKYVFVTFCRQEKDKKHFYSVRKKVFSENWTLSDIILLSILTIHSKTTTSCLLKYEQGARKD